MIQSMPTAMPAVLIGIGATFALCSMFSRKVWRSLLACSGLFLFLAAMALGVGGDVIAFGIGLL